MTEYEEWLKDNNVEYVNDGLAKGYASYGKSILKMKPDDKLENIRWDAIGKFSFAIPNEEALKKIAVLGPILEVGCGGGYWAYELSKLGALVIATDPHPLKGFKPILEKAWVVSEAIDAVSAVKKYDDKANCLLLIWPSMEQWPTQSLKLFSGEYVVHVGEHGGCTATDSFFDELDYNFDEIDEIAIPTWECVRDRVFIYKRKS